MNLKYSKSNIFVTQYLTFGKCLYVNDCDLRRCLISSVKRPSLSSKLHTPPASTLAETKGLSKSCNYFRSQYFQFVTMTCFSSMYFGLCKE